MFTHRMQAIASLLGYNLSSELSAAHFAQLPTARKPKSREAVSRSRYIPAGPDRNTHAAINDRRIRTRKG